MCKLLEVKPGYGIVEVVLGFFDHVIYNNNVGFKPTPSNLHHANHFDGALFAYFLSRDCYR
jgi:hypothetical protein